MCRTSGFSGVWGVLGGPLFGSLGLRVSFFCVGGGGGFRV